MHNNPTSADWNFELIAFGKCQGENWVITTGNEALARLLQIPLEQLCGQALPQIVAARGVDWGLNAIENFGKTNPVVLQCQSFLHIIHWHFLGNPEQKERVFILHEVPTHCFDEGLNVAERELKALLDSMHDGIWVIDAQGTTLRVNKALENMTGIPAETLVGKHVAAPMRDGRYSACVTLRALAEKKPVTMFDDYENGKRYLNTSVPILDNKGNVSRVIACIRDMSILEDMQNKLMDLELANKRYKNRITELERSEFQDLIGSSPAFCRMAQDIAKTARVDAFTLVLGETGTGKTFVAQSVHSLSPRRNSPFVTVNCGAIPPSLIESELFGYEKGAFTGAQRSGKMGLFESAGKGTIFLDEIAELPLSMQVKLLHVFDGGTVTRVGGVIPRRIEARVITATNRSLDDMVKKGEFREDLYYRLNVLTMRIPPLRERSADIPALARYFLAQANQKNGMDKILKPEVIDHFTRYSWPGNVRELRATIDYLVAMTERRHIRMRDLPERILGAMEEYEKTCSEELGLVATLEDIERKLIEKVLAETGNTRSAAKRLKISQSSVVRKAQRYKIGMMEVVHA